MRKIIALIVLLLLCVNNSCSDDFDDNLEVAKLEDVIVKDSEMFELINRVITDTDDPLEDIVCIDFVYPLEVKLYNSSLVAIASVYLYSDDEFSEFLGNLDADQALSISYPITTTFANGDTFTINNNTELKMVIDNCSREDIVNYCSSVFSSGGGGTGVVECVWKVQYKAEKDNKYVGGTFLINPDSSLIFNYNGIDYPGNWIFLFVNDELHININLEGISQVATDWNIDRKIIFWGSAMEIISPPKNIMMVKACQETTEYAVGDVGPANGIVFYDKGEYSNGWRYMEAAPQDITFFEWGCSGTLVGGTHAEIGTGLVNSAFIANLHDNMDDYYNNPAICNALNNGTVAAQNALLFGPPNFNDWFLPSELELALMYENLHLQGFGNFIAGPYWTSTEIDAANAQTVNFTDGIASPTAKIPAANTVLTRAIRYF